MLFFQACTCQATDKVVPQLAQVALLGHKGHQHAHKHHATVTVHVHKDDYNKLIARSMTPPQSEATESRLENPRLFLNV